MFVSAMDCVSVEITSISARDLESPAFNTAYAMVWINDDFINKQQMPVDRVNGTNLNHCIRFTRELVTLRQGNLILVIGIFTKAPIGDTEIDRVHIPLKDFVEPGCPMSLTRTIRTPSQSLDISLNINFLPRYQQYPPPHLPPYQIYPSPHQAYQPVLPQPHQGYQPIVPELNPPRMLASVARHFMNGLSQAVGKFVGNGLIEDWNASN